MALSFCMDITLVPIERGMNVEWKCDWSIWCMGGRHVLVEMQHLLMECYGVLISWYGVCIDDDILCVKEINGIIWTGDAMFEFKGVVYATLHMGLMYILLSTCSSVHVLLPLFYVIDFHVTVYWMRYLFGPRWSINYYYYYHYRYYYYYYYYYYYRCRPLEWMIAGVWPICDWKDQRWHTNQKVCDAEQQDQGCCV